MLKLTRKLQNTPERLFILCYKIVKLPSITGDTWSYISRKFSSNGTKFCFLRAAKSVLFTIIYLFPGSIRLVVGFRRPNRAGAVGRRPAFLLKH